MSGFDFSQIQEVNRINLQPDEVVVFRVDRLTAEQVDLFNEWVSSTPLRGRALLTELDFTIDVINPGGTD